MFEKSYTFVKEFTSPTIGNVYVGRKITLAQKQGQKFVDAGLAVETKVAQPKAPEKKDPVKDVGRSNTGGSKGTSSRNAK